MPIRHGFLIEDGKIFDTKIKSYELKKKDVGSNIIYYMAPNNHKRLYLYEPLLLNYPIEEVFEILRLNSRIRKRRKSEKSLKTNKLHYMANMSGIYNYPPTFLTQKRFYIYKICQSLKNRLV